MFEHSWEVRGLPLWLLQEYLRELGGDVLEDGCVQGGGWTARLTQLPDARVGSLQIGQVRLELQATDVAYQTLQPAIEKKLLRAGG